MAGADSPWDLIDHDLVKLKLTELAEETLESITAEQGQIRFDNRNNENRETWLLLKMHERRADESVEKTYQVYCDVWKKQGNGKTAAFVRAVLSHVIEVVINAQTAGVLAGFGDAQVRTNAPIEPHRARMAGFKRKMERLRGRWQRKLEIEAKECERYPIRSMVPLGRKRSPQPKPPCFESAVKLLRSNQQVSLFKFCQLMDSKAEQHPTSTKYRPPERWKVRSFNEQYKKRSNTVSRFLSAARKELTPTTGS